MRRIVRRVRGTATESPVREPREAASEPVQMDLVFDGADLLNWRSSDPKIEGLVLRPEGLEDQAVMSRRYRTEGPPHGGVRLGALTHSRYGITASRAGVERALLFAPEKSASGTANTAWGPNGLVWTLESDTEQGVTLVSAPEDIAHFGIRTLKALHGMVTLAVGPVDAGDVVQLEDRLSRTVVDVHPLRNEDGVSHFRIGATQWAEMTEPRLGERGAAAVWNLYVADRDGLGRRRRLGWAGSTVKEPREVLRYRATTSLMVPGRRIDIRPYWTKDQYLALEVKQTSSIEGELT